MIDIVLMMYSFSTIGSNISRQGEQEKALILAVWDVVVLERTQGPPARSPIGLAQKLTQSWLHSVSLPLNTDQVHYYYMIKKVHEESENIWVFLNLQESAKRQRSLLLRRYMIVILCHNSSLRKRHKLFEITCSSIRQMPQRN